MTPQEQQDFEQAEKEIDAETPHEIEQDVAAHFYQRLVAEHAEVIRLQREVKNLKELLERLRHH